jgi:hypothetical protein
MPRCTPRRVYEKMGVLVATQKAIKVSPEAVDTGAPLDEMMRRCRSQWLPRRRARYPQWQ